MFGFIAKAFGDCGTVRFEFTTDDGQSGTGKMSIESLGNSKEEVEEYVKNAVFVDKGIVCKTVNIIGFSEKA